MDRDRTENEQPRLVRTSLEKVRAQFSSVDLAVQDPRVTISIELILPRFNDYDL